MFGARPSGKVTKNKVLDNQIVGMKTTVSDHGLFERAWVGGWVPFRIRIIGIISIPIIRFNIGMPL